MKCVWQTSLENPPEVIKATLGMLMMRHRLYVPFNLVCLFARTRKNVCKQKHNTILIRQWRGITVSLQAWIHLFRMGLLWMLRGYNDTASGETYISLVFHLLHSICSSYKLLRPLQLTAWNCPRAFSEIVHHCEHSTASRFSYGWERIQSAARIAERNSLRTPCWLVLVMWLPPPDVARITCCSGSWALGGGSGFHSISIMRYYFSTTPSRHTTTSSLF